MHEELEFHLFLFIKTLLDDMSAFALDIGKVFLALVLQFSPILSQGISGILLKIPPNNVVLAIELGYSTLRELHFPALRVKEYFDHFEVVLDELIER